MGNEGKFAIQFMIQTMVHRAKEHVMGNIKLQMEDLPKAINITTSEIQNIVGSIQAHFTQKANTFWTR